MGKNINRFAIGCGLLAKLQSYVGQKYNNIANQSWMALLLLLSHYYYCISLIEIPKNSARGNMIDIKDGIAEMGKLITTSYVYIYVCLYLINVCNIL